MAIGRPKPPLELRDEAKKQLEHNDQFKTTSLPACPVLKIDVLMVANGINNQTIAQKVGLSRRMVGIRRERFLKPGIMDLFDEAGPDAPRTTGNDQIDCCTAVWDGVRMGR